MSIRLIFYFANDQNIDLGNDKVFIKELLI